MKNVLTEFITAFIIISLFLLIRYTSDKKGYERGVEKGVTIALDTVNNIVQKQLNNDTISSKLYIQSTDTLVFILSPKTIKMK